MVLLVILAICALAASMLTLAAVALSSRLSQNERALLRFPEEDPLPPSLFPDAEQLIL